MPQGVAIHRQSQQFTLAALFDFHEAHPQAQYIVSVHNNRIRTLMVQSKSMSYEYEQEESKINSEDEERSVQVRRSGGLFANLIKNMKEVPKLPAQLLIQQTNARRPYTFFYPNLERQANEVSPVRQAASAKKVKERATGIVDMKKFRREEMNQNSNMLNRQQPGKVNLPLIFKSKEKKDSPPRPFGEIALNFSFDEKESLIKQLDSQKHQIKITDLERIPQEQDRISEIFILKEESKVKQPQQKPEQVIPSIVIHEEKYKKRNVLSPIHAKGNHEFKDSRYVLSLKSRQEVSVEGAKKTQSYVIDHQKQDPKDIRIDFDLDINFI